MGAAAAAGRRGPTRTREAARVWKAMAIGGEWRTASGGDGVKWRLGVAPRCCEPLILR